MTATQISQSPRPNHVAALVQVDGGTFGRVVMRGRTFSASRARGTASDVRRYATGFRTAEAAARWIEAAR